MDDLRAETVIDSYEQFIRTDELPIVMGHALGRFDDAGNVDLGPRHRRAWVVAGDFATTASGDQSFQGGGGDDVLIGGSGDDELSGGPGIDDLRGRGGDDALLDDGLDEHDRFSGGSGFDRLFYQHRLEAGLTLTLDGIANDGTPGENENIPSDFEYIGLGDGDDIFVGDGRPTTVLGGRGDDEITGGAGRDRLYGGIGEDVFHTADGHVDWIWGRNAEDDAIDRDPIDRVREVEKL
jgi:Ca2+-binding RTX toxin-like protein